MGEGGHPLRNFFPAGSPILGNILHLKIEQKRIYGSAKLGSEKRPNSVIMSQKVRTLLEDLLSSIKLLPIFSTRLRFWFIKKESDIGF